MATSTSQRHSLVLLDYSLLRVELLEICLSSAGVTFPAGVTPLRLEGDMPNSTIIDAHHCHQMRLEMATAR